MFFLARICIHACVSLFAMNSFDRTNTLHIEKTVTFPFMKLTVMILSTAIHFKSEAPFETCIIFLSRVINQEKRKDFFYLLFMFSTFY